MKNDALLTLLEETAEKLSINLDYDDVRKGVVTSYGDSFKLRGTQHILIDKTLTTDERADLLIDILSKFDTEDIHLPPELRERFEQARQAD